MKKIFSLNKIAVFCLLLLITSMPCYAKTLMSPINPSSNLSLDDAQKDGLNPKVLQLGLKAYNKVREQGKDKQGILTIIDYTLPSSKPRFWVIDVPKNQVLYNIHVAHGKDSGNLHSDKFSDKRQSLQTSIGVYLTGSSYEGKHGYSLKLNGLDVGFNDKALQRTIVMHSAWYVSKGFLAKYGRLGRSWGCPALSKTIASKIIKIIKDGTVILAYYPDKAWLNSSVYLKG
jgi:hypothetical protein